MLRSDGGGGGGHFVGLHPAGAAALATTLAATGVQARTTSSRVAGLLDEAGTSGAGAYTAQVLTSTARLLDEAEVDLRWRITMLDGPVGAGGMVLGTLSFASAAEARAAGARFGGEIRRALWDYLDAEGDAEDAALQRYLGLLRGTGIFADDPAWSGGLIDRLGSEGVSNALWFSSRAAEGAVDQTRQHAGPVATALATAMRHRTSAPEVRRELLDLPVWDLGLLLAMAPAETGFLTSAARRVIVRSQDTEARHDDPTEREYVFVLEALADDAEASYRFLTGPAGADEPTVARMLHPIEVLGSADASAAAGRVLERGLVEYPAGRDAATWNRALAVTEDTIGLVSRMGHQLEWVHPQLNAALAGLLRPHLDAVAVIGAESAEVDRLDYDLAVVNPGGRASLDVDPERLREFLGAVMQQDSGVAHVQLLLGTYSQTAGVQANRLPLLDGAVDQLDGFIADSLRVAGLAGVVGQGLDMAGHDEESRTRLLTGAFKFATGQGVNRIPTPHPAAWLAQQGARYAAGRAVREFSDWVASYEPMEGEEGVDAFVDAYLETTRTSLREALAADPALAALPYEERERKLRIAVALVQGQVGEGLRPVYAALVGETEGDG